MASPEEPVSPIEEEAPWRKRAYGSLLKTPQVTFVPAGTTVGDEARKAPKSSGASVSNLYLDLVFKKKSEDEAKESPGDEKEEEIVCEVCKLAVKQSRAHVHERSTAHMCALPHQHPPHSLNRSSVGLKYLERQGWNPDARVGLGKEGEGILAPIKPVEKKDKRGIGQKEHKVTVEKVVKKTMGAKEARKHELRERKRKEALMRYMNL